MDRVLLVELARRDGRLGTGVALSDHLVAEYDPYLPLTSGAFDRLETGLTGIGSVEPVDVILQLAHEEQDPKDREGPRDQDGQQEHLIQRHGSHSGIR